MSEEQTLAIKKALTAAVEAASDRNLATAALALENGTLCEIVQEGGVQMMVPFVSTAPTWVNAMP